METESNHVVSLIAPLQEDEAYEVAGGVAPRLGLARDRLARLLSGRPGPITKSLPHDKASRIATILGQAGVFVALEPHAGASDDERSAWGGFAADADADEDLDANWTHGDSHGSPAPAMEPRREHVEWDDEFGFDWNQPLGYARWRRPVLLLMLMAAVGVFVWLQWSSAPPATSEGRAATYERGLDAYREGAFRRALDVWEDAAAAGDARAMYMLGYMSEYGQGQEWSNRRAAEYYRQAAERGSVAAQFALGSLYERGLGVPYSEITAVRWYRLAAENGHAGAQYRLGFAHVQGRGAERDYAAALTWFERAAANGLADAEAFVSLLRAVDGDASAGVATHP